MEIDLSNICNRRRAESRSLSAENFRGEKGKGGMATAETTLHQGSVNAARELGQTWKVSPCIELPAGNTSGTRGKSSEDQKRKDLWN